MGIVTQSAQPLRRKLFSSFLRMSSSQIFEAGVAKESSIGAAEVSPRKSTRTRRKGKKKASSPTPKPPKAIGIFTSDFESFRAHCSGAFRYKVHKPSCNCPGLVSARNSEMLIVNYNDCNNDESSRSKDIEKGAPQLSFSVFEEPLDGLLVVPQTKASIRALYLSLDTESIKYDNDPEKMEAKLRKELFSGSEKEDGGSYKVSCASCLLDREPNGFACVASKSTEAVDEARDEARRAADSKNGNKKHADHAHHVVTLPRSALSKLRASRTRSQTQEACDELAQCLSVQGVPIEPETSHIELGHHLTSLLFLTKEYETEEDWHWLVMVYDDRKTSQGADWTLDLAGGKRHLAETALQAAIRETEEEISLVWNDSWIREFRDESMNRYFLLEPPT